VRLGGCGSRSVLRTLFVDHRVSTAFTAGHSLARSFTATAVGRTVFFFFPHRSIHFQPRLLARVAERVRNICSPTHWTLCIAVVLNTCGVPRAPYHIGSRPFTTFGRLQLTLLSRDRQVRCVHSNVLRDPYSPVTSQLYPFCSLIMLDIQIDDWICEPAEDVRYSSNCGGATVRSWRSKCDPGE